MSEQRLDFALEGELSNQPWKWDYGSNEFCVYDSAEGWVIPYLANFNENDQMLIRDALGECKKQMQEIDTYLEEKGTAYAQAWVDYVGLEDLEIEGNTVEAFYKAIENNDDPFLSENEQIELSNELADAFGISRDEFIGSDLEEVALNKVMDNAYEKIYDLYQEMSNEQNVAFAM